MAWSLLNHMIAEKVEALLDEQKDSYGPEVRRFFDREKARAIIHAAVWGYSCRDSSTSGAYAFLNLMEALGIKQWTFDQDEADAFLATRQRLAREKYQQDQPEDQSRTVQLSLKDADFPPREPVE